MNYKFIAFFLLTTVLSSCCWLRTEDCYDEYSEDKFPIDVTYHYVDSVIDTSQVLPITISTTDFTSTQTGAEFEEFGLNIQILWFDGNFSSNSAHKVNILNSTLSGLTIDDYGGYYGSLPVADIDFDLEFTIPGYYLIFINGNAAKYEAITQRNRCSCGNGKFQNFRFVANKSNQQYFPLYNASNSYAQDLPSLLEQGAYFIKVE